MRKSRFTESQIFAVLKQGESGIPVAELCREHGISAATIDRVLRSTREKIDDQRNI